MDPQCLPRLPNPAVLLSRHRKETAAGKACPSLFRCSFFVVDEDRRTEERRVRSGDA